MCLCTLRAGEAMMDVKFGYGLHHAKKSKQSRRMMPRKSARLQAKLNSRNPQPSLVNSESYVDERKRSRIHPDVNRGSASVSGYQQFTIENKQLPISSTHAVMSSMIVPSIERDPLACMESMPSFRAEGRENVRKRKSVREDKEPFDNIASPSSPRQPFGEMYRFSNHFRQELSRMLPYLPSMNWTEPEELWKLLNEKVDNYPRSPCWLDAHPDIKPYMRTVLFTWMTEVCEMYKLHRETYYLAVEYTDRYLLMEHNIQPNSLQLIGVTALFMAAKVEEIYPPKLSEFAYVCDGAFDEDVLLKCELSMWQVLERKLYPVTPNTWIQLFLQIRYILKHEAQKQTSHPNTFLNTPTMSPNDVHEDACDFEDPDPLMSLAACALQLEAAKSENPVIDLTNGGQEAAESDSSVIDLTNSESGGSETIETEMKEASKMRGVEGHERSEVSEIDVVVVREESAVGTDVFTVCLEADGTTPVNVLEVTLGDSRERSEVGEEPSESISLITLEDSEKHSESDVEELDEDDIDLMHFDQSLQDEELMDEDADVTIPQYSIYEYLQVSRCDELDRGVNTSLIDSAILDRISLHFSYKTIAAAALLLTTDTDFTQIPAVTGMMFPEIERCVYWLKMHQMVIGKHDPRDVCLKEFEDIKVSDCHKIQYNSITKEMWEETHRETEKYWNLQNLLDVARMEHQRCSSPPSVSDALITPPRSNKKATKPSR